MQRVYSIYFYCWGQSSLPLLATSLGLWPIVIVLIPLNDDDDGDDDAAAACFLLLLLLACLCNWRAHQQRLRRRQQQQQQLDGLLVPCFIESTTWAVSTHVCDCMCDCVCACVCICVCACVCLVCVLECQFVYWDIWRLYWRWRRRCCCLCRSSLFPCLFLLLLSLPSPPLPLLPLILPLLLLSLSALQILLSNRFACCALLPARAKQPPSDASPIQSLLPLTPNPCPALQSLIVTRATAKQPKRGRRRRHRWRRRRPMQFSNNFLPLCVCSHVCAHVCVCAYVCVALVISIKALHKLQHEFSNSSSNSSSASFLWLFRILAPISPHIEGSATPPSLLSVPFSPPNSNEYVKSDLIFEQQQQKCCALKWIRIIRCSTAQDATAAATAAAADVAAQRRSYAIVREWRREAWHMNYFAHEMR